MEPLEIIRKYGIRPKRMFSQNFLVDTLVLEKMVLHGKINKGDTVLEIGSGFGFLTALLAKKAKDVIAFEIDKNLINISKNEIKEKNVKLINQDFLKTGPLKFDKVVSSIPYHISSQVTFKLFEYPWSIAVLCYQKEFAARFFAEPGGKNYSRLTVMTNYFAEPELLDIVPKSAFYPVPKVDSMLVKLTPKKKKPKLRDEKKFFEVVACLFQHKKQKVRNALVHSKKKLKLDENALKKDKSALFSKRVFQLSMTELVEVYDKLESL